MNISLRNSSIILACLLAGLSTLVTAIPQSYTASDGVEYVIERDQVYNWLQAHTECVSHGLQLAIIDSAEKNQAFEALLRPIFDNPPHLWIGLHDNLNTAETLKRPFFSIVDGSQIKFSYWNNGEPNNALYSEHCTHIGMANNFKWNDDKCEKKFGYICEKPQAPVNISCDLNETRKTVYQLNEGLAKDHKNNQEEVQGMLNDNRLQTQSVLQEWQKSSQKSLKESQKSINDIFASKPYLQAVIADVGQPIKQIIREAYNEIAKFSYEAQQTIDGNSVVTQTSIMNKSHAFQQKLEENTNGVDGLLAEHE